MKILILGGTGWLGHAVAETALAVGHDVTCLARGTAVPKGASLVRADRDHDDALAAVTSTHWDVAVDLATHPGQVRRAVRDLEAVSDRYIYVSSVSAYASHSEFGADETMPLEDPLEDDILVRAEDYGAAKSAGEQAALDAFGPARTAILRPGLIGGPGDPSGRTGYWALRFARPSNPERLVLVPDEPGQPTSVIDVRDLARWIVFLTDQRVQGRFNCVGVTVPLGEHLETARLVAGQGGTTVPVSPDWLIAHGVAEWSGPRSLPLWLADSRMHGMNARSNAKALATGLVLRPLSATLADSFAHDLGCTWTEREAGLTDEEERELIAESRKGS